MTTLSIVVIWSFAMVSALLVFRAYVGARRFATEMKSEFNRMDNRLHEIEGMTQTIRTDAEIHLRTLANIAMEARTILERARAVTQFSNSMEGEQLKKMLENHRAEANESAEFVNAPVEDKVTSVRSLFA